MEVEELIPISSVNTSPLSSSSQSSRKRSRINELEQGLQKIHVSKGKEPAQNKHIEGIRVSATAPDTVRFPEPRILPEEDPIYSSDYEIDISVDGTGDADKDNQISLKRQRMRRSDSLSSQSSAVTAASSSKTNVKPSSAPPGHVIDLTTPSPITATTTSTSSSVTPTSPETPVASQAARKSKRQPSKAPKLSLRPSSSRPSKASQGSSVQLGIGAQNELRIRGMSLVPPRSNIHSSRSVVKSPITDDHLAYQAPSLVATVPKQPESSQRPLPKCTLDSSLDDMFLDGKDTNIHSAPSIDSLEPAAQEMSDEQLACMLQEQEYSVFQPADPVRTYSWQTRSVPSWLISNFYIYRYSWLRLRAKCCSNKRLQDHSMTDLTRVVEWLLLVPRRPPPQITQIAIVMIHNHPYFTLISPAGIPNQD